MTKLAPYVVQRRELQRRYLMKTLVLFSPTAMATHSTWAVRDCVKQCKAMKMALDAVAEVSN